MTTSVLDSTGSPKQVSTTVNPIDGGLVGSTSITDSVTGVKQTVSQLHNADQQAVPGSAYSALAIGVSQLQDSISGLVNRQREIGQDNVPPLGVSSGGTNFAMQFKTTCTANLAPGAISMTLVNVTGTIGGVPWTIKQGSKLLIDLGGVQETLTVATCVVSTKVVTFTTGTSFAHNGSVTPFIIIGFTYNQVRDASGENDGASGSGTEIAAEYEYNGADPSGGNFDRSRNLNAKGIGTQTISGGTGAGSVSLTVSAAAGLQPGQKVLLYRSATFPAAGSFESVNIDIGYVPASTTVTLASALINATVYDTIAFDSFAALGPQLNGFLSFGIGIESLGLYDSITGKLFAARMAPGAPGVILISSDGIKPAYRYAGNYTPVATPTDSLMIQGSATKTIRIKRIVLGGLATAAGNMPVTLIRRSTQFTTQGTAVFNAVTAGKHDSGDAAATAVIATIGTANITSLGATPTNLGQGRVFLPLATTQPFPLIFEFATRQDKALILRGITDFLFINFAGAAVPTTGTIDYEIETEEDNS